MRREGVSEHVAASTDVEAAAKGKPKEANYEKRREGASEHLTAETEVETAAKGEPTKGNGCDAAGRGA